MKINLIKLLGEGFNQKVSLQFFNIVHNNLIN